MLLNTHTFVCVYQRVAPPTSPPSLVSTFPAASGFVFKQRLLLSRDTWPDVPVEVVVVVVVGYRMLLLVTECVMA